MQKIVEQPPPKEALAIAETLSQLGFNIQLLGSEKCVLTKLQTMSDERLEKVREAFIKTLSCKVYEVFFVICHLEKIDYVREAEEASLKRLANLIKVCSFLMQTKVYLFWKRRGVEL